MKRSQIIVASTLALAVALGGGLLSNHYANAAAETAQTQTGDGTGASGHKGEHKGEHIVKKGAAPLHFGNMQTRLLEVLNLDAATFKQKLQSETLAQIGQDQGISRDELKNKMVEWLTADQTANAGKNLNKNVDLSAVADKILDGQSVAGPKRKHLQGQEGSLKQFPGKGVFMFGDQDGDLGKLLGVTADELKEALKSGKTLAAIAGEHGVDVQAVIDQEVGKMTEHLDQQLADGKLTQEQVDQRKAELTDKVTKMVNGERPEHPEGMHGQRHSKGIQGSIEGPDAEANVQ